MSSRLRSLYLSFNWWNILSGNTLVNKLKLASKNILCVFYLRCAASFENTRAAVQNQFVFWWFQANIIYPSCICFKNKGKRTIIRCHICCQKVVTVMTASAKKEWNHEFKPWRLMWFVCSFSLSARTVCFLILQTCVLNCNLDNLHDAFSSARILLLCLLVCWELLFIPRYLNGSHVLQLGGVNENISYEYPQLQHKHYTGCIRNLLVDSKVWYGTSRVY